MIRRRHLVGCAILAFSIAICARESAILAAGTEITVRITEDLTSLTHFRGEELPFELARDVECEGRVVMKAGSAVRAQITNSVPAGARARAGVLTIEIREGIAIDGQAVRLTGVHTRRGPRRLARLILTTAFLGLISLAQHGEEARFTRGEILAARTRDPITCATGGSR
jgi:hypothetical protein